MPNAQTVCSKVKVIFTTFIKFCSLHNVRGLRYLVPILNQQFFLNPQSLSVSKPTQVDTDKRNKKFQKNTRFDIKIQNIESIESIYSIKY